jgi:hypothetical protein
MTRPLTSSSTQSRNASSQSHYLEVVVAKVSRAHNLQSLVYVVYTLSCCASLTEIGPDPEMTVVPAELTTFTETTPVVIPKNENPLKPGVKV